MELVEIFHMPGTTAPLAAKQTSPDSQLKGKSPKAVTASKQLLANGRSLRANKRRVSEGLHLRQLLATQQKLRTRVAGTIVSSTPILMQDGEGVIWPNTINLIQGQTGTHKSRVAELISSCLIAKQDIRGESLGITRTEGHSQPYTVCYVDTERNQQEQFVLAIQQIQRRAGYDHSETPENFEYISLLDIKRTERLSALDEYLHHLRVHTKGHLVIVLDQLADCVADFNDPKESMLLTDLLNVMVNQQDVTFICIIHENPGGSKARGHLGTEGANKASTVLQVSYLKSAGGAPGTVLQMKYIKRRSGSPNLTFHVQFDTAKGELVRADGKTVKAAIDSRKTAALPTEIIPLLANLLSTPLPVTQLKKRVVENIGGSEKTVGGRLRELMMSQREILNLEGEVCHLREDRQGKQKICQLVPVGIN